MKFTVILIGVMLLRGIELHRHMNRHGHKRQRTDPQTEINYEVVLKARNALNEIDELNKIDKAVGSQQSVDMTKTQKDVRSNPGDEIENVFKTDGTRMALDKPRDGKITPKSGLRKNKLVAKYGTHFRYLRIVKNGIDRVTVVTSILIPRFKNVKIKPINFARCAQSLDNVDVKGHGKTADTQASIAAKEWCAQAIPYMEYLQQQEKYYIEKVHELLCDDLYSALPELKLVPGPLRKRRGIGALILSAIPGLITLAVESVSPG